MRELEDKCPWCKGTLLEDISGLIFCNNLLCKYDSSCRCDRCGSAEGGVCPTAGEVAGYYTCPEFMVPQSDLKSSAEWNNESKQNASELLRGTVCPVIQIAMWGIPEVGSPKCTRCNNFMLMTDTHITCGSKLLISLRKPQP